MKQIEDWTRNYTKVFLDPMVTLLLSKYSETWMEEATSNMAKHERQAVSDLREQVANEMGPSLYTNL